MPKIAAVQMSMSADAGENYMKSVQAVSEAAANGADLVCFPEGQFGRYVAQYPNLKTNTFAMPMEHEYVKGMRSACAQHRVMACISLCLKERERVFSAGVLVGQNGEILAVEKKKHIVRAPNYYEQDYFTAGKEPFRPVETPVGRIGILVCFDRHYPESFRSLALQGCDFAIVPVANDREEPLELFQWEMRVPAFQNGMYVLMLNRVGTEGTMDFAGQSVIAGPDGAVCALAGDREEILYADLDFARCAALREKTQYLKLRRREMFTL